MQQGKTGTDVEIILAYICIYIQHADSGEIKLTLPAQHALSAGDISLS
jgi:hypothetical protein